MTAWGPLDDSPQAVALEVLRYGPIARADLARRLGLSSASLTRLTKPLVDEGLLIEGAPTQGSRTGRPSRPLAVVADSAYFMGIKIVRDALYSAITDLHGEVLVTASVALPDSRPAPTLTRIVRMIARAQKRHPKLAGVGIGIGGVVEHQAKVRVAPLLGWENVEIAAKISERTGLPCVIENDVKAFTQAEHWFGAGRGLTSFAVITVGAGIGCGLVVHDHLLVGHGGVAGAIGHTRLKGHGRACEAGHPGCARALLTTDSVAAQLSSQINRVLTFDEVLDLGRAGDAAARQVIGEAGYYLGVLAGMVANVTGPDRMLLSGDGIGYALLAEDSVRAGLRDTQHWTAEPCELIMEPFEFSEWARGAAAVAIKSHVFGAAVSA